MTILIDRHSDQNGDEIVEKNQGIKEEETELVLDSGFEASHTNSFGHTFRDYDAESERRRGVEEFYRANHIGQTVDFVRKMREEYGKLNRTEMSIWECCELLNEFIDESDPDLDEPQIEHLLQTAEAIRKDYPDEDWLHLTGLIHDLGKVLLHPLFGELPQWAVVGDTYPVGCAFDESVVHHKYFKENQDYDNPSYNTKYGIYTEGCGLDNVLMSWGHDDYMYLVAKENQTTLPSAGLFIIRYLEALRDFINELEPKPDGWSFNSAADCCEWVGITCNSSSSLRLNHPNNTARITKLELVNRKLSGRLSESLGLLDQIRVLNLSQNFIFGSIPPSVFNLIHLETLDLSSNGLIGQIPHSLNLPFLINLHLSSNELNGSLPVHVCHNSTELRLIRLELNYFSGEIPSGFEKCALLEQLFLGGNNLTGNIPDDLFHLRRLNLLKIQENGLSGSLSPALGNLSHLAHLDVSGNSFSGEIPDVFNKLLELNDLMAQANRFTGGIPKSLANSETLILLNLRNNSLSGPLRLNCAVMTNLTTLDLGSNRFNGSFPENLPACRNLRNVNLARNHLGQVPESFKDFHSLSYLSLSNCSLVNISTTLHILQHCKNLTTLVLTLNFHGGILPDDPNLHFEKLVVLAVANCRLTGQMPSWLSKSTNLQVLDLSWNNLTGAIPNLFGGFTYLFYLDLSRNSFTGKIPKSLTRLHSLTIRDVSFEELPQDFTFFYKVNENGRALPYKHIVSFPPTLELSQNNLSGPVWEEFGNLKKLHIFDLSANRLSGSIPSSLSEMTSLEVLDLSNNRISGSIPESLESLTFLSKFSVANNNLSGRIPYGGQFNTFPSSSFEGNHLCGDYLLQCQEETLDNKRPRTSESDSDSDSDIDFVLDFSYGVALGFGLSLVIVAFLTCSAYELHDK